MLGPVNGYLRALTYQALERGIGGARNGAGYFMQVLAAFQTALQLYLHRFIQLQCTAFNPLQCLVTVGNWANDQVP